jgi:hypothetical protein
MTIMREVLHDAVGASAGWLSVLIAELARAAHADWGTTFRLVLLLVATAAGLALLLMVSR